MRKLNYWDLQPGIEYAAYDGDRMLQKTYRINAKTLKLENSEGGAANLGKHWDSCQWIPVKQGIRFVALTDNKEKNVSTTVKKTAAKLPKVADLQAGNILSMQEGVVYVADSGPLAGVRVTRVGGKIQRVRSILGSEVTDSKVDLATQFKPVGKIKLEQTA